MADPAKRSLWLFVAGCILLAIGIVLLWADASWGLYKDTRSASYGRVVAFSVFAMVCGPLLMLADCIFFCIKGEPEQLRRRGRWLAVASLLYIFAVYPFSIPRSASVVLPLPGIFCAFLACLMASVGWLRSRLQHK